MVGFGAKSNNNFHSATGKSVFDARQDARFAEYRRKWKENPAGFVVGSFPLNLDIESTSCCNLRCPQCARTHDRWGIEGNGHLDFDLYKAIVDEGAANGLCAIKLSLRGEPLLHPRIADMVRYALEKGILDVYFNTNVMLLDEKMIHSLIDVGLPRISLSIEGTTPEVYEKYRPGATFEKLVHNVKTLWEIRSKCGALFPQIRIQTVLMDELKDSFDEYVNFWRPYADEVSYLDYREEGPGINHRGHVGEWACPFLWQRMTILWDGTLLPCLAHGIDDHDGLSLGKVPNVSIRDMWVGEKVELMRTLHRNGKSHENSFCDQCSYRALELQKILKS